MTTAFPESTVEAQRECLDALICRRYQQAENEGTLFDHSLHELPIVVPQNSVLSSLSGSEKKQGPSTVISTATASKRLKELDLAILASKDKLVKTKKLES